jgi:hypothetical protein
MRRQEMMGYGCNIEKMAEEWMGRAATARLALAPAFPGRAVASKGDPLLRRETLHVLPRVVTKVAAG